jgi:hypothetical protein
MGVMVFDETYKYVADWVFCLKFIDSNIKIKYLDELLVIFSMDGVSNKFLLSRYKEIGRVYNDLFFYKNKLTTFQWSKNWARLISESLKSYIVIKVLPLSLRNKISSFRKRNMNHSSKNIFLVISSSVAFVIAILEILQAVLFFNLVYSIFNSDNKHISFLPSFILEYPLLFLAFFLLLYFICIYFHGFIVQKYSLGLYKNLTYNTISMKTYRELPEVTKNYYNKSEIHYYSNIF